ncbi:hypothetical protein RESH_05056 [Rhodopirellula europaea SH398]|uniref:Uncharacterized protein n=1 Tax=Rhodopirellula europaea SH398 TaxID=1263868 RepID=M5S9M9_9BACT|nr:hypothetical protein RESH_05056 [Rhodopirellula europaea SH398]
MIRQVSECDRIPRPIHQLVDTVSAYINHTGEFRVRMEIANDQFEHSFAIGFTPMHVRPFGDAMFGD